MIRAAAAVRAGSVETGGHGWASAPEGIQKDAYLTCSRGMGVGSGTHDCEDPGSEELLMASLGVPHVHWPRLDGAGQGPVGSRPSQSLRFSFVQG